MSGVETINKSETSSEHPRAPEPILGRCCWRGQPAVGAGGGKAGDLGGGDLALTLVLLSASPGMVWDHLPEFSEPQAILQDEQSTTDLRRNPMGWYT